MYIYDRVSISFSHWFWELLIVLLVGLYISYTSIIHYLKALTQRVDNDRTGTGFYFFLVDFRSFSLSTSFPQFLLDFKLSCSQASLGRKVLHRIPSIFYYSFSCWVLDVGPQSYIGTIMNIQVEKVLYSLSIHLYHC